MPVSKAVLSISRGLPRSRAASSTRGSPSWLGRRTCQPGQLLRRPGSHCNDSSRATGTWAAKASRPAWSAGARGCSSHCSRGSPAKRPAQAAAVARLQPPLASRRRRAVTGRRFSSCSSSSRSKASAQTANFHLNTGAGPSSGSSCSKTSMAAGPAGSSRAAGGGGSQRRCGKPASSARAAPRAKARVGGNWPACSNLSSSAVP